MKRIFALALLVSGVMFAGMVSASMKRTDATSGERLWSNPDVRASVVYRIGNTVRIFVPEGNNVLCKGEKIPVFRPSGNTLLEPSGNTKMNIPAGTAKNMLASTDLRDKRLIGEVKIFKLVGDNYAYGKLVTGEASQGDLAAKPSRACLAS